MKKRYIGLTGVIGMGVLVMAALAMPARAADSGFYLDADAGVALADKVEIKTFFGPTPGTTVKFDPGIRFGVAGGYNFNRYIGAGFETGFIYNNIKSVNGGGSIDASLSHIPMMANVVIRYDQPDCKWVPYGGVGAGGDVSIIYLNNVEGNGVIADGADSTIVFAWQAFGGVRYKFNEKMSLGAGYKYYSASGASWDFADFSDSIKIGRANVHSLLVEFNLKF